MPPAPLGAVSVAVLRPGTLVTRVTLRAFGAKGNFVPEPGALPAGLSHSPGLGEPSQGVPRVTLPGGAGGPGWDPAAHLCRAGSRPCRAVPVLARGATGAIGDTSCARAQGSNTAALSVTRVVRVLSDVLVLSSPSPWPEGGPCPCSALSMSGNAGSAALATGDP